MPCLVGRSPRSGGFGTRTPSSCAPAFSSAAAEATHTKSSCWPRMATWRPYSSRGAALLLPPHPHYLRAAVARLPARDGNGAACFGALARASSPGGGEEGRSECGRMKPRIRPGEGIEDAWAVEAIFPGNLLSASSVGKTARAPLGGGVGVAESALFTASAATSTLPEKRGMCTCRSAVGVADVVPGSCSAATSTS